MKRPLACNWAVPFTSVDNRYICVDIFVVSMLFGVQNCIPQIDSGLSSRKQNIGEINLQIPPSLYFRCSFTILSGPSWSCGSWIYNYMCNHCLSPLKLWVRLSLLAVHDTTLCDKVCQWLAAYRWFSSGTTVSSTNKSDRRYSWNIIESGVKQHNPNPTILSCHCCYLFKK